MLPAVLNFEDSIKAQMIALKIVVTYFLVEVVLSFAVAMELDTTFFEKHGTEPQAQPFYQVEDLVRNMTLIITILKAMKQIGSVLKFRI